MFFWAKRTGVKLHSIQPGKPTQSAFVESFNGKFRDYCLDLNWFASIDDARSPVRPASIDGQRTASHVRPRSCLICSISHIKPGSLQGVRSRLGIIVTGPPADWPRLHGHILLVWIALRSLKTSIVQRVASRQHPRFPDRRERIQAQHRRNTALDLGTRPDMHHISRHLPGRSVAYSATRTSIRHPVLRSHEVFCQKNNGLHLYGR